MFNLDLLALFYLSGERCFNKEDLSMKYCFSNFYAINWSGPSLGLLIEESESRKLLFLKL